MGMRDGGKECEAAGRVGVSLERMISRGTGRVNGMVYSTLTISSNLVSRTKPRGLDSNNIHFIILVQNHIPIKVKCK